MSARPAVAAYLRRTPLRLLLVGTLLLVVLVGLVGSAAAVTVTMRQQLVDRVDDQLRDAAGGWAHRGPRLELPRDGDRDGPSNRRPPSQFYVEIAIADGTARFVVDDLAGSPRVPDTLPAGVPTTVPSRDGDGDWRVLAVAGGGGDVVVIGLPLDGVDRTVGQLVAVQAAVGAIVLALLGAAGWFLVGRSLRPLADMEVAAGQIAAGDLDRRLPERPRGTEVGELTHSFNEMITRIQGAFAATEASEAAARRSEEKMRRFVADASHELRTPLTSIKGFAELYRTGMTTDADQAVGRIESEAGRMGSLVEDLLTLARLDAERPLERRPVDVADVVSEAVSAARVIDPARSVALSVEAVPVVVGDEGRLRQVVSNLVVNALRHAGPDASVWVTVGSTGGGDDGGDGGGAGGPEAVIRVRDDGVGMTADDAGRAFERFHRADDSRTRGTGGGSGLGLSIAEGIVAAHGGRIELDAAEGEGTTVTVRLPVHPG